MWRRSRCAQGRSPAASARADSSRASAVSAGVLSMAIAYQRLSGCVGRRRAPRALAFCGGAALVWLGLLPAVAGGIVRGTDVEANRWPWAAQVWDGRALCTGSLVAKQWVLTAAHCIYENGPRSSPKEIGVYLGGVRPKLAVTRLIIHKRYGCCPTLHYDLALLKLAKASQYKPVGVVTGRQHGLWQPGKQARVFGWGRSTPGHDSNWFAKLREATVPMITDKQCTAVEGSYDINSVFCAGALQAQRRSGICDGDSGGPLVSLT